jgi:hypothetical protein
MLAVLAWKSSTHVFTHVFTYVLHYLCDNLVKFTTIFIWKYPDDLLSIIYNCCIQLNVQLYSIYCSAIFRWIFYYIGYLFCYIQLIVLLYSMADCSALFTWLFCYIWLNTAIFSWMFCYILLIVLLYLINCSAIFGWMFCYIQLNVLLYSVECSAIFG